jgi:outer membrane protein assembly factor BamB
MGRFHRPRRRAAVTATAGVLAAVLGVLLAGPASAAATTTVWRTDGYGPGNTGYNPVETTVHTANVGTLNQRWSIVSPVVRNSCAQQSPPVVAGGKLYLTDQGGVAAYHAGTGARVWSYRFPDPVDTLTPRLTVLGSRLLVAMTGCLSQSDPDGELRTLDANTGAPLWLARRDAPMYVMVVDKDVVAVSGQDVGEPEVTGYRVSDGAQLWTRRATLPRPVSGNGRLLLTRDGGSDLVDIRTGSVLWSTTATWSVLAAGPTGGPLYAAGPAGELARMNAVTGAVDWSVPGAAAQLAVDGPRLYVAQGGTLVARDAVTGGELWRREYGSQLGKPVVAGGVVYATVSGSGVYPLNAATGAALDDNPPYDGAVGHPVVVNGRLYVTTGRLLDAYTP